MKRNVDTKRKHLEYQLDDWVWLKLQPYHQSSVNFRSYAKLIKRYFGPFKFKRKVSSVAYELSSIHFM